MLLWLCIKDSSWIELIGSNAEGSTSVGDSSWVSSDSHSTNAEKQPLADIFFQKLFGKRRASLNGGFSRKSNHKSHLHESQSHTQKAASSRIYTHKKQPLADFTRHTDNIYTTYTKIYTTYTKIYTTYTKIYTTYTEIYTTYTEIYTTYTATHTDLTSDTHISHTYPRSCHILESRCPL